MVEDFEDIFDQYQCTQKKGIRILHFKFVLVGIIKQIIFMQASTFNTRHTP